MEMATIDDLKDVLMRLSYSDLKVVTKEIATYVNFQTPKVHGLADALADWANDEEIEEDTKEVRATT
jgi:hypothetical protein